MTSAEEGDRRALRWAGILLAIQAAHLLIWLRLDRTAAMHDDSATHLRNALLFWQALTPPRADSLGALISLWSNHPYPPLAYLLSVPAQWLLGPSADACCLVGVATYLAAGAGVFCLGRRLDSARAGLQAMAVVGCSSTLLHLTQQFWIDSVEFALTVWALVAALASDGGRRPGPTLACGLLCGLGLLCKWSFAIAAGPLLAYLIAGAARRPEARRPVLRAVLVGLTVCLPWYVTNFQVIREFAAWNAGLRLFAPPVASLESVGYYALTLASNHLFLPLWLLAAVGLIRWLRAGPTPDQRLLLAWSALVYVGLTLIQNKSTRYALPLLPVAGLAVAIGCPRRRWLDLAVAGLCAANLVAGCWGGRDYPRWEARAWPNGPVLLRVNRLETEPWDVAAAALGRAVVAAAAPLPAPAVVVIEKAGGWGLTPLASAYFIAREAALRPAWRWPPTLAPRPRHDYRWEGDIPTEEFDGAELAVIADAPFTASTRARLDLLGAWVVDSVTLPDGTRMLVYRLPPRPRLPSSP